MCFYFFCLEDKKIPQRHKAGHQRGVCIRLVGLVFVFFEKVVKNFGLLRVLSWEWFLFLFCSRLTLSALMIA